MESKSERQHGDAKETEDIQGAQESAQASSETQASSSQSEEQSLPSDHLKKKSNPTAKTEENFALACFGCFSPCRRMVNARKTAQTKWKKGMTPA